jgi:hypothetical protein
MDAIFSDQKAQPKTVEKSAPLRKKKPLQIHIQLFILSKH